MSASVDSSMATDLLHTGVPLLPRVNLLPAEIGEASRFRRIKVGLGGGPRRPNP